MPQSLPFDPEKIRAVIFDADGVLVHGKTPHPGAIELLDWLRSTGRKVFVLTNNSSIARRTYAAQWRSRGFSLSGAEVITSGYLTALYFREGQRRRPWPQFRKKMPHIFVVGGVGIPREFARVQVDATLTRSPRDARKADFVVAGIDYNLSYRKIARAQHAIREEGALFVATNCDPTFPTESGHLPGAGVSINAIATAAGRGPDVIVGKPNPLAMKIALTAADCSASQAIMVGDRLDTDIESAKGAGVAGVLVLSGSTSRAQANRETKDLRQPDLVLKDVTKLRDVFA